MADVVVPYEPLGEGPTGHVVRVEDVNQTTGERYDPLDLDALGAPYSTGLPPSTTRPRFAAQMVYAVTMQTYERFRLALGRTPDFAFEAHPRDADADGERLKLHVLPHAMEEDNAYYDRDAGALLFGYTRADERAEGTLQPGALVFTSLCHDIVVHEMTHALLDGLRAQFLLPTNPDVEAFHEGFADLLAVFERFRYRDLVKRAIGQAGGGVTSRLLTDIARQFGQAMGGGRGALRTALLADGGPDVDVPREFRYDRNKEVHDLGGVLVAAVFDAYRWIFNRKTDRLRQLAPARDGRLPDGLVDLLAGEADRLAGQFLNIVVRAVDYCPPVDVTFGEYLRAMVTADYDIVPDDPWGYREALVQAFRRYGITVDGVPDLTEDALLWQPPERSMNPITGLEFGALRHGREPGQPASREELLRRADVLGAFVTRPEHLYCFGLAAPVHGSAEPIERVVIESVRTLRRVAPDGRVSFDLVAEVTQRRKTKAGRWVHGGSTIVIDAGGRVRYAICKHVNSQRRELRFLEHMERVEPLHQRFFDDDPPSATVLLRHLHGNPRAT